MCEGGELGSVGSGSLVSDGSIRDLRTSRSYGGRAWLSECEYEGVGERRGLNCNQCREVCMGGVYA